MATLDELLSQETKPEQLSEPLAGVHGDLDLLDFSSAGGSSNTGDLTYTINLDATYLSEVFAHFAKQIDQMRTAIERLEAAVADLEEDEDDNEEPLPFSGPWHISPGSLYVSNNTDWKWEPVGGVESASVTFNGAPLMDPYPTFNVNTPINA